MKPRNSTEVKKRIYRVVSFKKKSRAYKENGLRVRKERRENIILKSFIGCCLAILFIYGCYLAYDNIFNYEIITHIEKWEGDGSWKDVEYNSEVICEEGINVEEYWALDKKVLYSCLYLDNRSCSGKGKICLIKTTERIRK